MEGENSKGTVCVIGGTGFLASWLIFKLLESGYSVNTTIRSSPGLVFTVKKFLNLHSIISLTMAERNCKSEK